MKNMKEILEWYTVFENWFNANLGWFFTNGNKVNHFDNNNYD